MSSKTCTKCHVSKPSSEFYNKRHQCKTCRRIIIASWQKRNPSKVSEYRIAYREADRKRASRQSMSWDTNHPGQRAARLAKYKAAKLQRTPRWLSETQLKEIQSIYTNCPKGYEVDHIVPLQGNLVSGLHVPWNLQYLKVRDNRVKYNKI